MYTSATSIIKVVNMFEFLGAIAFSAILVIGIFIWDSDEVTIVLKFDHKTWFEYYKPKKAKKQKRTKNT